MNILQTGTFAQLYAIEAKLNHPNRLGYHASHYPGLLSEIPPTNQGKKIQIRFAVKSKPSGLSRLLMMRANRPC